MDKATLLLAASHTLRRKLARGAASACRFSIQGLAVIGAAGAALASMALAGILAMAPFALAPGPHSLSPLLIGSAGPTPVGWAIHAAASCLGFAALLAISAKDGALADSKAAALMRLNGWLMAPWFNSGRAMLGLMHDDGLDAARLGSQMGKLILAGLAMPILLAALIWTLATSLLIRLGWALRSGARAVLGAGASLTILALQSPDIVARQEADALGKQSKPGDPGSPSTRL